MALFFTFSFSFAPCFSRDAIQSHSSAGPSKYSTDLYAPANNIGIICSGNRYYLLRTQPHWLTPSVPSDVTATTGSYSGQPTILDLHYTGTTSTFLPEAGGGGEREPQPLAFGRPVFIFFARHNIPAGDRVRGGTLHQRLLAGEAERQDAIRVPSADQDPGGDVRLHRGQRERGREFFESAVSVFSNLREVSVLFFT